MKSSDSDCIDTTQSLRQLHMQRIVFKVEQISVSTTGVVIIDDDDLRKLESSYSIVTAAGNVNPGDCNETQNPDACYNFMCNDSINEMFCDNESVCNEALNLGPCINMGSCE